MEGRFEPSADANNRDIHVEDSSAARSVGAIPGGQSTFGAFTKELVHGLMPYNELWSAFSPGFSSSSKWFSEWLLPLRLVHHLPPSARFLEMYSILEHVTSWLRSELNDTVQTDTHEGSPAQQLRDTLGQHVDPITLDETIRVRNALLHGQADTVDVSKIPELIVFLRECIAKTRTRLSETCELFYLLDPIVRFPSKLSGYEPIYIEIVLFELRRYESSYFREKHFGEESAKSVIRQWLKKTAEKEGRRVGLHPIRILATPLTVLSGCLATAFVGIANGLAIAILFVLAGAVSVALSVYALEASGLFGGNASHAYTRLCGVLLFYAILLIVIYKVGETTRATGLFARFPGDSALVFRSGKPLLETLDRFVVQDWHIKYDLLFACAELEQRLRELTPPARQNLSLGDLAQSFEGILFLSGNRQRPMPDQVPIVAPANPSFRAKVRIDHLNSALSLRNQLVHPREKTGRCSIDQINQAANLVRLANSSVREFCDQAPPIAVPSQITRDPTSPPRFLRRVLALPRRPFLRRGAKRTSMPDATTGWDRASVVNPTESTRAPSNDIGLNANGYIEWLLPCEHAKSMAQPAQFLELYSILEYLVSRAFPESMGTNREVLHADDQRPDNLLRKAGRLFEPQLLDNVISARNRLLHSGASSSVDSADLETLSDFLHQSIHRMREMFPETCDTPYLFDGDMPMQPEQFFAWFRTRAYLSRRRRNRRSETTLQRLSGPAELRQWLADNTTVNFRWRAISFLVRLGALAILMAVGTFALLPLYGGVFPGPTPIVFAFLSVLFFSKFLATPTRLLEKAVWASFHFLGRRYFLRKYGEGLIKQVQTEFAAKYGLLLACADLEIALRRLPPFTASEAMTLGELVQASEDLYFPSEGEEPEGTEDAADALTDAKVRIDHLNSALRIRNILAHPRDGMDHVSLAQVMSRATSVRNAIQSLPLS